MYTLWKEM